MHIYEISTLNKATKSEDLAIAIIINFHFFQSHVTEDSVC